MEASVESVVAQVGSAAEAMFGVGLDGRVVSWNAGAAALLGIPATRAVGAPCWQVAAGAGCRAGCSPLRTAAAGRADGPCDVEMNGRRVRVHHLVLRDASLRPRVLLHLLDDVGEHRSLEAVGARALGLSAAEGPREPARLTRREREVLRLLCQGLTAREVARSLGVSYTTARAHIQHVNGKLGAHNRAMAVAAAVALPDD